MLYLSRLILNTRHRDVQRELADCNRLHGQIMGAFPAAPDRAVAREHFGVLYRLETLGDPTRARLLVQSNHAPDWSALSAGYLGPSIDARGNPAVRSIEEEIGRVCQGMRLRFRLRANPTKRVSDRNTEQDARWHGKRIELRREPDQLAWLERKASAGGFRLLNIQLATADSLPDVRIGDAPKQYGQQDGSRRLNFGVALFEGRLEVADTVRFAETLRSGIGTAKAYGFGLLSIALLAGGDA
jgi:CRISPR system Cascade subunit CasE